jgi:hypothetical protein
MELVIYMHTFWKVLSVHASNAVHHGGVAMIEFYYTLQSFVRLDK